jgi:hypothetical protein
LVAIDQFRIDLPNGFQVGSISLEGFAEAAGAALLDGGNGGFEIADFGVGVGSAAVEVVGFFQFCLLAAFGDCGLVEDFSGIEGGAVGGFGFGPAIVVGVEVTEGASGQAAIIRLSFWSVNGEGLGVGRFGWLSSMFCCPVASRMRPLR